MVLTILLLYFIAWFYVEDGRSLKIREVLCITIMLYLNYYLDYQTRTLNSKLVFQESK